MEQASSFYETLSPFFYYRTTKYLKVKYPGLGLTYYALSLIVIIFYGRTVLQQGDYLIREPVVGRVNPFGETVTHPLKKCVANGDCTTVETNLYNQAECTDVTAFQFIYSSDFKYINADGTAGPECKNPSLYETYSKKTNFLSFSTVYAETQAYAWQCGDESNSGSFAQEANSSCVGAKTNITKTNSQCECEVSKAVFPIAIEENQIHIEHTYTVASLPGHGGWQGNSKVTENGSHPLDTVVKWPNGTKIRYPAGNDITITLREVVAMAGGADENGVATPIALNDMNTHVSKEYSGTGTKFPRYRHTGMAIEFIMEYSNMRDGEPFPSKVKDVDAEVTVKLISKLWTSVGPSTFYPRYPHKVGTGAAEEYHRVVRYPQDIEINFVYRGNAFAFDVIECVNALVALVVIAGVAKTIMDLIVFNLIPCGGISEVLRNKRDEKVDRLSAFQEIGMKAAISVNQFHRINDDRPGNLNLNDLVSVFGTVEGFTHARALEIAKTILGEKESITFNEFMSITEGDKISFTRYLSLVKRTASMFGLGRLKMSEKEGAMKAFNEEKAKMEQGIKLEEAPTSAATASASDDNAAGAAPMTPAPVQQPVLPPGVRQMVCYNCKKAFGVPPGVTMVACPHCGTHNQLVQSM